MSAFGLWVLAIAITPCPLDAQAVPVRRATQVFRFGGPDAREPYAFAGPPSLVVDSAGFIHARLASQGTVVVFDADGKLVRTIGRKGEGPGEFQVAYRHGLIGDTLWVTNWPTPRISMFRTDGAHLVTRRTPVNIGQMRLSAPAGISGLLTGGRAYVALDALVLGEGGGRVLLPVLVGSREMQNIDTVTMVPSPQSLYVAGVGSWAFQPMPSSPLFDIASAGTAIATAEWDRANPGSVTVRVVAPDGTERLRRQLQLSAQPMPKRVRDSLLAIALEKARPQLDAARRRGTSLRASNERLVEEGLGLPDHYPPVRSLRIGIDGTLWLERFGEGRRGDWLVLDRAGAPLFHVQLPATLDVQEASATDVWGTDRDDLDVSYLVRLRLTASNNGRARSGRNAAARPR